MLLEEDDERGSSDGTGPCLEFFLQERIMETLCALCLVDRPKGVRRLILSAITSLLSSLKVLLIPHMSIHQPLCNLVHGFTSVQLAGEATEAVILIKTLLSLIQRDPTLAEFFITTPVDDQEEGKYSIWAALVSLHRRTAPERREKIEECIVTALNTANEFVIDLMDHEDFGQSLASECIGFHTQLPSKPSSTTIESDELFRFKLSLRFIDKLTSERGLTDEQNPFSSALIQTMCTSLFDTLIPPELERETETAYYSLYVKEMLQICSGPLLDHLLRVITSDSKPVFGHLVERLLHESDEVRCNTLRLFDTVLGLYRPATYNSLFLRHIVTSEQRESEQSDAEETETAASFKKLLEVFPCNADPATTTSTLDGYVWYARETIGYIFEKLQDSINVADIRTRSWDQAGQEDVSLGPLLTALFSMLKHCLDNSLKCNLLVTALLARLLQYPSRPLFQAVQFYLVTVVGRVSVEAEQRCDAMVKREHVAEALRASLATLQGLRDIEIDSRPETPEHRFFEALVVIDEFVSELVAIESAVAVYDILLEKQ